MYSQKTATIINLLGSLLIVLGLVLFLPFIANIFYQDGIGEVFMIAIFISLTTGLTAVKVTDFNELSLSTGMIVCGLGWIVISIVGALPFYLALDYSYLDSFFETVSGFTTTGITVFSGLSQMPGSILIWRSLTQWLGGLGILTFFLVVTFRGQSGMFRLFTAESHKMDQSRPTPNINKSIQILWVIYTLFTVLQMVILYFLGLSVFDAVNHSLTTLSTGGFSPYDESIAYFSEAGYQNYILIEYVIIFFMTLGGINFMVHYKVLKGKIKEIWQSIEMKYFWGLILSATLFILVNRYLEFGISFYEIESNIRKTLFQVISILTTTGFGTQDIGSQFFPPLARQIFILFMFIGGCVGSTGGGFKVIRVVILKRMLGREIKKITYPKNAVLPIVIDGNIIPDKELFRVVSLFVGWILVIIVGGGLTALFSDLPAWNSFSGIFSAVGNIGPSYISVEEMQGLSDVIKIKYIFAMLAGRLEILPLFIIFSKRAWRD